MWFYPDRRVIRAVARAGAVGNFPIGSPVRMVLVGQPHSALAGVVMSPNPFIAFVDIYGNIVSNVGVIVTATPSVGTMSGTTAIQAAIGGADFSNLIFDDIVNTIMGERTITFSCPGFSSVVSAPIVVTKASLKLWMEADYGVVDANGAAMTSWADRSPTGTAVTPAPTKSAPIYRTTGFGGVANLPYWDYLNAHGAKTPQLAALALTTSTEFYVVQRDAADANCAVAVLVSDVINQGIQDAASSVYASRWNAGHTVLNESSYNNAGGWIPKGSRKLIRHEMGGTHATHKVYLNGVQQVLPDQFVNNPGTVATSAIEARLGYRDVTLPALDMLGQFAAALVFTPVLSAAEAASVESYLTTKWLGASSPVTPRASRGPILYASQVIDGVTVNVTLWESSSTPDFASSDHIYGRLIFSFSEPIKRFRCTLVYGQIATQGIQWYRLVMGVRNYTGPYYFDYVTGDGFAPGIDNQTVQINDTVTGFTHVITELAPISGSGFLPTSILKDCYFSKMTDP